MSKSIILVVLIIGIFCGNFAYKKYLEHQEQTLGEEVFEYMQSAPRSENQEPDDALGTHLTKEHRDKVIDELKNMGYSEYLVFDYYMLKDCPDGHLGFVIAFTGMQFKTNRKYGYLCPPYHNEMVYYSKKALF